MKKKIKEYGLALFLITILVLWSFRNIVFVPGLVGRTWDWGTFTLKEQALIVMSFFKYSWWAKAGLGFPLTYNAGFYTLFIVYPLFYLIGPILASKLIIILFLMIGAYAMFLFCRFLKLNFLSSLLAGIFYMFNPPIYSRLVAGHISVVFGYALIPFYLWAIFSAIKDKDNFYLKIILAAVLLSIISSSHQLVLGVVFIINLFIFIFYLFSKQTCIKSLKLWTVLGLLFVALNSFWLYPFLKNMLVSDAYFRGDLTVAEEMKIRLIVFNSFSNNLSEALIMSSTTGLGHEFVYPIPEKLEFFWRIASYVLVGLLFLSCFIRVKEKEKWIFWFIAILGVCLLTGNRTVMGRFLFQHFFMKIGAVFFMFSRVNRLAFLVSLSYAVLLGYWVDFIIEKCKGYAKEK